MSLKIKPNELTQNGIVPIHLKNQIQKEIKT